jgi:tape measure domain-containing protein
VTAIVDVGINIVASKALQGMKRIQDRTNQLAKSMRKFQRTSDNAWTKFGNKVRKTRRKVQVDMERLKRAIGGLNIGSLVAGAGLGLFAKNAIQTAGNAQALELRLKLLTQQYGEYEKAQAIASKAAKTFGLSNLEATEGITNIIGRLRPLGVSLKDIESTYFGFNTAAKLAGVSSMEASNAFRQLAQALGSGRLQGDEFRSLAEQVPTLLLPIANELGTTVGKLKEFGAEGKITSDVVLRALKKIEKEGAGKIGSIVEQSALQRFKDFQNAMEDLSVAIGKQLLPAVTPVVKAMTALVGWFAKLNPVIQKAAIIVTALAAAVLIVAPAVVSLAAGIAALKIGIVAAGGLGVLTTAAIALTGKILLAVAAVWGLYKAIKWLVEKIKGTDTPMDEFKKKIEDGTVSADDAKWKIRELSTEIELLEKKLNKLGDSRGEKKLAARLKADIEGKKGEITGIENAVSGQDQMKEWEKTTGKQWKTYEVEGVGTFDRLTGAYLGMTTKMKQAAEELSETEKKAAQKRDENMENWKNTLENIKTTIKDGLTDAIMGLIDGTKSLGESLAGIAKQIASMALRTAIGNILPFAEGGYVSNGIKPFSSGGMVRKPTMGLVGEAGEDEYIIPASKMAQSMQRYSAGARGESVIPGTGSSAGGAAGTSSTTVNYSGPILNFNSEEFVPKSAIGQIINSAAARGAKAGEARTLSSLQNSRSRRQNIGL